MKTDFDLEGGIYIVQEQHELDLHNNYDFNSLNYSIEQRTVTLEWVRSTGDWVPEKTPYKISITLNKVSEFRFLPRNSEVPFTEDDCINIIGYWPGEEWADGVVALDKGQKPEPNWPLAIEFQSQAILIVQSEDASAEIA